MAEDHIVKVQAQQTAHDRNVCSNLSVHGRHNTLFQHLVSPDTGLPQSERSVQRLATEAQVLLGAGTVTTTRALTYLAVHILLNESVKRRLGEELRGPMATFPRQMPSITELEKLRYLRACIKEGLR